MMDIVCNIQYRKCLVGHFFVLIFTVDRLVGSDGEIKTVQ